MSVDTKAEGLELHHSGFLSFLESVEVTKFKHLARRAKTSRNASLMALKKELSKFHITSYHGDTWF